MTKEERVEMLEEAQRVITQAMEDIRSATNNDAYTEFYLVAPLSTIVGEGKYISADLTIEDIIEQLDEMDFKDDEVELEA